MSLELVILGFLNYAPFTGYDLKKLMDQSTSHFWSADQSQIYRTLARLSEHDLARSETVPQEGRPDRKVYHITPAGRAELLRWLNNPLLPEEEKVPHLVQVFFAGQLSDEEVIAVLHPAAERIRGGLQMLASVPETAARWTSSEAGELSHLPERERFFWMLTLEYGLLNARTMLEWLDSVIVRLESHDYTNRLDILKTLTENKNDGGLS
jgi:DNA-binding PadR family transcriptional regulator